MISRASTRPGWRAARATRTVAVSPQRRHLSAQDAAPIIMESFAGKTAIQTQLLDGNQLQKLALTLQRPHLSGHDVSHRAPPNGTPMPPAYHLVYFTPNGVESELGVDGTDKTYNAPSPFSRRMWAGGTMQWEKGGGGLRVGDEVTEETKLLSATAKQSKNGGEMVLVEVEKKFSTQRGLGLTDRRSWIFRPEIDAAQLKKSAEKTGLGEEVVSFLDSGKPTEIRDTNDGGEFPQFAEKMIFINMNRFNHEKLPLVTSWLIPFFGPDFQRAQNPLRRCVGAERGRTSWTGRPRAP